MIEIKHKETGMALLSLDLDTLEGVALRGADLRSADLQGFSLPPEARHDLWRADLRGIDLEMLASPECFVRTADQRNLIGNEFSGARYDGRTRWPEGFDPQREGAVRE